MAISPFRLDVGKIRSTGSKFPWEPGYVASVRAQLDDLQKIMKSFVKQVEYTTPEICLEALRPTYEKSLGWCPVDTGDLRQSGYLEILPFRGQQRVEMGYGKHGIPFYAVIVHENLEYEHKPPTQAKWLERAVTEDLEDIQQRIVEGMQAYFKSGEKS